MPLNCQSSQETNRSCFTYTFFGINNDPIARFFLFENVFGKKTSPG